MYRQGYQLRFYFPKFADNWCRKQYGDKFIHNSISFEKHVPEDGNIVEYEGFIVVSEKIMADDFNIEIGDNLRRYFELYLDEFKRAIHAFITKDDRDTRLVLVPFIVDYVEMQIQSNRIATLSTELDGIHVTFQDGSQIVREWDFFIRAKELDFNFCNSLNILGVV